MGDLIELIERASDRFEIFSMPTELVAAFEVDGKKRFKGIASSTTKDLHGDTILLSALQDMERTAVGLTMFLNHSYNVPDDVGGTIDKAIIKQKGVDGNGDPAYLLEIEGEVEDDNPEALKTHKYVAKGRRIGLSIGAMIPDGGAKRQKDGSYVIEHLNLLEVSFVGIPANPKSWVEYAASALRGLEKKAQTATLGAPVITLDSQAGTYEITGSLGDLKLAAPVPAEPEWEFAFSNAVDGKTLVTRSRQWPADETGMAEGVVETLGAWDFADPDDKLAAVATIGEAAVAKATVWVETRDGDKITIGEPPVEADGADTVVSADVEPDTTKACPTCGKGKDSTGCSDAYHKNAEPDVADAKVRIIEVDTDDPQSSGDGQGASSSEPDDADTLSAEADVTADAEPVILDELTEGELLKLSFGQVQAAALLVLNELIEVKRQLGEEKQARAEAERQRDAVIETAGELVARTKAVIEKVANSPLPRKATLKGIETEFSQSVESYYGSEIARAIGQ